MNRELQIKIIAYLIGMILIPVLIISLLFLSRYNSFMSSNKYKYIEVIRLNNVSFIKEKFKDLEDELYRMEKWFVLSKNSENNKTDGDLLSKEERIHFSSIEGFQNAYFFDGNLNLFYKIFDNTEIVGDIAKIIDKEIVKRLTYKSLILDGKYYNISILRIENNKKTEGYVVIVVNNQFFNIDSNKTSDILLDVYDNNFNLIKTNSNKKLFSKEINSDTKNMLDGYVATVVNKQKSISYGFIDLEGDDVYLMVTLDTDKYTKSDSFRFYIVIGTILSVILVFLLGWKLIGFVNIYIDKSIENKEYDDYTLNKFKVDLKKNINNIDRVTEDFTDFQVLKQDLIKLSERFSEGRDTDEDKRNKGKENK